MAEVLKRVAVKIEQKQNSIFTFPIDKQKKYIEHFPEPKDGIERSYFQYCCQMKLYGKLLHILLNIAALPMSVYYLNKFKKHKAKPEKTVDAVFFNDGKPFEIVPNSVVKEYLNIKTLSSENGCLSKDDKSFLKTVFKRYPFSWMFWLKLILKTAQYSDAITKYSPKAIVSCSEFSYTSSVLTEYCHARSVSTINVMHGEKLYYMRDSFLKYDRYYVWDKEYIDLLSSLRSDSEQFIVEVPASLVIKSDEPIEKQYDFTYYLQNEDETELRELSDRLKQIVKKGFNVSIRPHPRYTNMDIATHIFTGINIENCKEVSIQTSILRTKNVISKYSSVLNQAYHSGIEIVIDDLSNIDNFKKLKELKFVMLSVEHKLLSDIVED